MSPLAYTLLCIGSVFSIVDPFAAVPVFLALLGGEPRAVQLRAARRASVTCFVVLVSFALLGRFIFAFFGITLPAFKIAGGVLLFLVALEMVRARRSETRSTQEEESEALGKEDVGLMPIGLPLLSGPGAIATVMVLMGKAEGKSERIGVVFAIFLVSVLCLIILRSASFMSRVLGRTGMNVIGRAMGLILAAVSVQFVLDGVREAMWSRPLG